MEMHGSLITDSRVVLLLNLGLFVDWNLVWVGWICIRLGDAYWFYESYIVVLHITAPEDLVLWALWVNPLLYKGENYSGSPVYLLFMAIKS